MAPPVAPTDVSSGLGVNPRDLPYPIDIVHPFLQLSIDSSNILIILSENRRGVVAYGDTCFSPGKQNGSASDEGRARALVNFIFVIYLLAMNESARP